jgi:MFS family permease
MELGKSIQYGSIAASIYSVGSVAGGYLLGLINDKLGIRAGLVWGAVFTTIGMVGMILSINNGLFLLPACLIMGFGGLNMYGVQAPLVARTVVGDKHFSEIWAIMMMGNSMIAAFTFSPIGGIYDATGTFRGAFYLGIAMFVVAMFLGFAALSMSKSYRAKHEKELAEG